MLRAAAQDSVLIPQRSDENKDLEDFEGWVMGDDGKPLYIVDTEGVTLEKLKKCKYWQSSVGLTKRVADQAYVLVSTPKGSKRVTIMS